MLLLLLCLSDVAVCLRKEKKDNIGVYVFACQHECEHVQKADQCVLRVLISLSSIKSHNHMIKARKRKQGRKRGQG